MAGEVIDVMLIPDYQHILLPCIDPKLQNLHREAETQHQWLFEAVTPDFHFPFGCRTLYRAYCSDKVIEFHKKSPDQCVSKIGRYIGLEPVSVICKWYPSAECDNERIGVEGMSILTGIPDVKVYHKLKPYDISEKAKPKLQATLSEVLRRFTGESESDEIIRDTWFTWHKIFAPDSPCPYEYETKLTKHGHKYHVPLRSLFFVKTSRIRHDTSPVSDMDRLNDDSIIWPEMRALAMPSVMSTSNPSPPAPRLFVEDDVIWQESMTLFNVSTAHFYDHIVDSDFTSPALKDILKTTLTYTCRIPTVSGKYSVMDDVVLVLQYTDGCVCRAFCRRES